MKKDFLRGGLFEDKMLGDHLMPYAVARIRSRENSLLNAQDLENLIAAGSYSESIQYLLDRGWGPTENDTPEQLINLEKERVWDLLKELLKARELKYFDVFRISNDYHNLKAAIKESYIQKEVPNVYMKSGTVDVALICKCASDGDFTPLPEHMEKTAIKAREILFQTGDSQLFDVILDRACLEDILKAAEDTDNDLLKEYAQLQAASANINIAVRACMAGKDESFLEQAFVECGSLNTRMLINAARNNIEEVYDYLKQTIYADAADAIKESPAAFERWCDNRMIRLIRPQRYNAFTVSPLVAFLLAKNSEIKSVRLILSGKFNHLPEEKIRERLRESYV